MATQHLFAADDTGNDFRRSIAAALTEHDLMMGHCPVTNPPRGRVYRPNDRCPRCDATASGTCGLSSGAGYHLANAVRRALARDES